MDLDAYLHAICAGDTDAFGRWMAGAERCLRESLRSFATRVDVEAVLQEALLRTWNVAPRVKRDGKPNALLRMSIRIARNLAIDEARRARLLGVKDDPSIEESLAFSVPSEPDPLLVNAIRECHDKLPNKPKEALAARLESEGGEHDATIAARLGMRLNTFLQNFTRARKLLADCLHERGIDLGELA
jgi:RNA polymerase sigma-70 factor (ECF subfamily)